MKKGLSLCKSEISGVGFDTWGVDCGFLSKEGELLGIPGSYRDSALDDQNMKEPLELLGGEEKAFAHTGIASLAYNTIYKIYYMQKTMPSLMESADKMLLMPKLRRISCVIQRPMILLNHIFTGKKSYILLAEEARMSF